MDKLHCAFQIKLAKQEIFFGSGVLTLLKFTEKYGSLNAAAKNMNLSYSKATRMINGAENALGFKLLDKKIGGAHGGGSTLTPQCLEFTNNYEEFSREVKEGTELLFNKYFEKYM